MDILISVFMFFFALYGVIQLLYNLALFFAKGKDMDFTAVHKVIFVDDNSYNLENYVRYYALNGDGENFILINKAYNDEIIKEAEILACEFNFVQVMEEDAYLKFISEYKR